MSLPIEETVAEITDGDKPFQSSRLVELSGLSLTELELLKKAWPAMELKRRRQIISRLVELAEENFELDYDSIFCYCLRDQDAEVRSKAIEGLWESEEASLISPLVDLLEHDSSEKVQAAAATALGKFARLAEDKKLRSCYIPQFCQALLSIINNKSKDIEVRRRALEAAAPLNLPQVEKAIMSAYESDNPRFRASAIYSMGERDRYWLPFLLKELGSADVEIRYEAVGACGELGEEEAVPYIVELTDDPDIDIRLMAIQSLGKIGGTKARECLEQCLENSDEAVRQAAKQALQELEMEEDPLAFRE